MTLREATFRRQSRGMSDAMQ
ncbi:hypothetical protein SCOCK_180023 [Actinacidiphila cocklensis]|uniref:Uncharacterized protein n=1 Tax=Actinacidiphila cocklensis TaxID=887465 RepID=A0A9W4DSC6_9ACTN|nr:hypothetical protein SCOCK_180023 [Actinacidiphila cocklensis]